MKHILDRKNLIGLLILSSLIIGVQGIEKSYAYNKDEFYKVKLNDKWGFINSNGDIIVKPQFENYSFI